MQAPRDVIQPRVAISSGLLDRPERFPWLAGKLGKCVSWAPPSDGDVDGCIVAHEEASCSGIPTVSEPELSDPGAKERFLTELFAFARLRALPARIAALQGFHADYKYLLLAKDPERCGELGRMASSAEGRDVRGVIRDYGAVMLEVLRKKDSRGRTANALQHLAGHFSDHLGPEERSRLFGEIEAYRRGVRPLLEVLDLLRTVGERVRPDFVASQALLEPFPRFLRLD